MGPSLSAAKVQHLGRSIQPPEGCPLQDPALAADFSALMRHAGRYSQDLGDHAMQRGEAAMAWLHQAAAQARPMLRPWVMELLFVVGAHGQARFSELEQGLGISSKVLAARLRDLVADGHVARHVTDTTPVTITYSLTKTGRATAALAAPLFTHLNLLQA